MKLELGNLKKIRTMNKALVSYNIEMTEVTGGTFWKAYTPEQIAGTEQFPQISKPEEFQNLMQWYDPIDLKNKKLRTFAKGLKDAYVRVSGTWANSTYYDFENKFGGKAPEGYQSVLTKEQWLSVLDYCNDVNTKLLISFANCPAAYDKDGNYKLDQIKEIFEFSKKHGKEIDAVEFMNEPNIGNAGLPDEYYQSGGFAKAQDRVYKFIKENYPSCLTVGPCALNADGMESNPMLKIYSNKVLLNGFKEKADIFSYHYYNGVSERGAFFGGHWNFEDALKEEYFKVQYGLATHYINNGERELYSNSDEMWVTESGDAGCGGNTWASTFTDTFRTFDEFGLFSKTTNGVIFHNTLASSD
ncbi:MAG: beta-glucuronidase, partial [Anaeroplasmataceae bacterium]